MVLLGSEACSETLAVMMGSQNVLVISYFFTAVCCRNADEDYEGLLYIHSVFYDKQNIYKA